MSLIAWLIIGGVAGWLASILMKANAKMGLFANILVGIVGAALGGFLFRFIGGAGVTGLNLYSLGVAVLGSMLLLWLVKKLTR
jgi:uncharacterized membrane protein YeaQ/YmgE (transglycosylase-associated protein family)